MAAPIVNHSFDPVAIIIRRLSCIIDVKFTRNNKGKCPTRTVNQVNDFISCSNGLTTTFSYYPSQRTVPVYLNNLDCRQTTIFLIVFTSNRNRLVVREHLKGHAKDNMIILATIYR